MTSDRDGLPALGAAFGTAALAVSLTWVVPGLEELRPWSPGEPLPVIGALVPREAPRVMESASGELVVVDAPPPPAEAPPPPAPDLPPLPERPPGVPTRLVDPEHRGMDRFYRALHRAAAGEGLARAAQWGDSTIAADGITSTVRARLQARFGNGGPGYLSAGMDPQWMMRFDVGTTRTGEWTTHSLLSGNGGGRYGFGGIVSTAAPEARVSFSAPKLPDGSRLKLHRFEVYYQAGPERGGWWATLDGAGAGAGSAAAAGLSDRFHATERPQGYTRATIGASADGPATFYGVVMETAGPGVVWDALGVTGIGPWSFAQQGRRHLAGQVARRSPDLVAIMLGGNDLGARDLVGDGAGYVPYFLETVERLRAGAPESACLILTPLDQGTRKGGTAQTKPTMGPMVSALRLAAAQTGCAFWDAQAAMGGAGSIVRWSRLKPPLAWTDLLHLSSTGQEIVGNLLADAIEAGYDHWVATGGPDRPPPAAPALPGAEPAAADAPAVPAAPAAALSAAPVPSPAPPSPPAPAPRP